MDSNFVTMQRDYVGALSKGSDSLSLKFSVFIENSGEANISLGTLNVDAKTEFISDYFYRGGSRFELFSLEGVAADGVTFVCHSLIFTSLGGGSTLFGDKITPVVSYSEARMVVEVEEAVAPTMIWRFKNLRSFHHYSQKSSLGLIEMAGSSNAVAGNKISGAIKVTAESMPVDISEWRERADNLCSHLQKVMSFAGNVGLNFPVIEFHCGKVLEMELYSRREPKSGVWPPFHFLHLNDIFECGIRSYFSPGIKVEKLPFAIEWFNMHSSSVEANLITAMTVLENLMDSNLSNEEKHLMDNSKFDKLRRALRQAAREEAGKWIEDEQLLEMYVVDLNERFADIKRRSLLEKLKMLADRWGVPLQDIKDEDIQGAKSARDQVVHRGHYTPKPGDDRGLHEHVLLVREIVVRFVLTALSFKGHYESYVGGYHTREFERAIPQNELDA